MTVAGQPSITYDYEKLPALIQTVLGLPSPIYRLRSQAERILPPQPLRTSLRYCLLQRRDVAN